MTPIDAFCLLLLLALVASVYAVFLDWRHEGEDITPDDPVDFDYRDYGWIEQVRPGAFDRTIRDAATDDPAP